MQGPPRQAANGANPDPPSIREEISALSQSLEQKPNQPEKLARMLKLLAEGGDHEAFLESYHRLRPYGAKAPLRFADQLVARMAREGGFRQDAECRRLLALIAGQQGWPQALQALGAIWQKGERDPELARYLAVLSSYNGNAKGNPPLSYWQDWLEPRDFQELQAAMQGRFSPTLSENLGALSCVFCRGAGLEAAPEGEALACPSCGQRFPGRSGVPLLLRKPLEAYRDIEPQYWSECEKTDPSAMWLETPPGMEGIWRRTLLPAAQAQKTDNVAFLKAVFYSEVHWLRLLDFFLANAPAGEGRILDLGCYQGVDLLCLARLFPRHTYFGLEVVLPAALIGQRFRGPNRIQVVCADATDRLPFADESIDLIFSCNAIEHCGGDMMREGHRVLKPGGRALIMGPGSESFVFKNRQSRLLWLQHLAEKRDYEPHSLTQEKYWEAFRDFRVLSHTSDCFFFRELLEDPVLNRLPLEAALRVYQELCSTLGRALDADPRARWYNYIQIFELEKPA